MLCYVDTTRINKMIVITDVLGVIKCIYLRSFLRKFHEFFC